MSRASPVKPALLAQLIQKGLKLRVIIYVFSGSGKGPESLAI